MLNSIFIKNGLMIATLFSYFSNCFGRTIFTKKCSGQLEARTIGDDKDQTIAEQRSFLEEKVYAFCNAVKTVDARGRKIDNLLKNAEALNRIMNSTIVLSSTGETVAENL
jgi:hypothetical protein